jgi:hypothetical protein
MLVVQAFGFNGSFALAGTREMARPFVPPGGGLGIKNE